MRGWPRTKFIWIVCRGVQSQINQPSSDANIQGQLSPGGRPSRNARLGVAFLIVRGLDLEGGSTARSSWTCSPRIPSASDLRGPVQSGKRSRHLTKGNTFGKFFGVWVSSLSGGRQSESLKPSSLFRMSDKDPNTSFCPTSAHKRSTQLANVSALWPWAWAHHWEQTYQRPPYTRFQ